ncbi:low molecular weight protein-tyrosine-phosphatase [Chitinophaga sp. sic0106]|uniref:low molecular weight protein-tyrosine-phosphatase n=1 Tax=Chitinophaga sp. sic0106 TaxID=2854785 RepID=UPI001C4480F3|nr:low molecular weight protein-tyrosine-phosphatase [Chitinophaga sp. sic0106]MBV7533341.1 low molecular weight phosphotyrosine protein phosphatase [Chitinophaga sp. sic0106]
MVCLGNICRSPLAEGVMRYLAASSKHTHWEIDSAGTGNWHIGDAPDKRSTLVAKRNGIDISTHRGQQFSARDFDRFDRIYVMDRSNYNNVIHLARHEADRQKVHFLLENEQEVPDPYFDDNMFAPVYELIFKACERIINKEQ